MQEIGRPLCFETQGAILNLRYQIDVSLQLYFSADITCTLRDTRERFGGGGEVKRT
jgi:hypothetical protein